MPVQRFYRACMHAKIHVVKMYVRVELTGSLEAASGGQLWYMCCM